jgi:hypothetical protein
LSANGFSSLSERESAGRSEESDNYHAVVAQLNADWCVIVCRPNLQWILQRHAGLLQHYRRHSGHGRTYCWLDPVANDPTETLAANFAVMAQPAPPPECPIKSCHHPDGVDCFFDFGTVCML